MPGSWVGDALLALASAHVGHLIGDQLSIAGILCLDRQLRKHALVALLDGVVDGQVGVVFFALNEAVSARRAADGASGVTVVDESTFMSPELWVIEDP
jgi:hypothetical protein